MARALPVAVGDVLYTRAHIHTHNGTADILRGERVHVADVLPARWSFFYRITAPKIVIAHHGHRHDAWAVTASFSLAPLSPEDR
jgi:hypothetical protein